MSSAGSAPVRQPVSDAPESYLPLEPLLQETRERRIAFLRLFWECRRLLFRAAVLGIVASAAIALLIPNRYEATTQLMPPDVQAGTGMAMLAAASARIGAGSSLGNLPSDLLGVKTSGALFIGILKSRTVADRLVGQFQLMRVYRTSKIEDTRKALAEHTGISEDLKSGILTITVIDHDPRRGAAMAQAYVDELDRLVANVSTSSARRERIFLEERLRDVKSDLDATAQRFSEFASKNTAIDIPAQSKAMVEAAATLQGQLIAAQSELRGLEQIYTENNVRVRSMRARVVELRQQLQKLSGGDLAADPPGDNSSYPSIRKLPLLGVTYADLYRQTKIRETVYELLTQQYELAKVEEAKEIPAVKVLDAAVVPTKKSFPPRTLIVACGTTFALAVAAAYIAGKARWDALDGNDPGKLLAQEIFAAVRAEIPLASKNGSKPSATDTEARVPGSPREDEQREVGA